MVRKERMGLMLRLISILLVVITETPLLTDHSMAMALTTTATTSTIYHLATSLRRLLQPPDELQTGAQPRGLEQCTPAIRWMSPNRNRTLMLFPMPASHPLLVSKLSPILVTSTVVPGGLAEYEERLIKGTCWYYLALWLGVAAANVT